MITPITYDKAKAFCENFARENAIIFKEQIYNETTRFLSLAIDNFGGTFLHLSQMVDGAIYNWRGNKEEEQITSLERLYKLAEISLLAERTNRDLDNITNLINSEYD